MATQCTPTQLPFHPFGRREVVARFDAGHLTSDGGALLLREADLRLDLTRRIAACFADGRQSGRVEHGVEELVAQRVHGLALGYEDLNDHDRLRSDPLLALAAGKADPTGLERARARDRGHALAGSSTLNRLELGEPKAHEKRWRYSKIVADGEALDRLLVKLFLESHGRAPETVWLDLDATDDPLHGAQEGRFFHGYYKSYCYLPLYLQRRTPAVRTAAPVEHRRGRGQRSGVEADRRADPATLPGGANRGAGRLGLLPRRDHGLVRTQRRGLRLGAGAQRAPGQAHRQGPAQVPVPSRGHGPGIAAVSGLPLPHARFLEPNAPRGGQGGMVEEGGQPTLRGHQPVPRGCRRPISVREVVLRARGHGKQNQGMPVASVRRPHRHGDATRQPTAAALRLLRLRVDARVAAPGAAWHALGKGAVRHDPDPLASMSVLEKTAQLSQPGRDHPEGPSASPALDLLGRATPSLPSREPAAFSS